MNNKLFLLLVVSLAFGSVACGSEEEDQNIDESRDAGVEDEDVEEADAEESQDEDVEEDADEQEEPDGGEEEPDDEIALDCPALPARDGNTEVTVSPADIGELSEMIRTASDNTTFLFEDGTYELTNTLQVRAAGVELRSASGNAEAVILDGAYDVNSLVFVTGSSATIAHITLTRSLHHPIHVTAGGGTDVTNTMIYGVRIIDGAQQFIKINPNGERTAFVDDGVVECSYFELTDEGRPNVDTSATGCYTGGVDAHGARGWVVRNNEFRDIYCDGAGLAEHAVHFWTGSRDTLVENNLIVNCARGVGFGLRENGDARTYDDDPYPGVDGLIDHYDGLIRNNIIYADIDWYDTGMELNQSRGVRVYHNTIYTPDASGAYSSIDYRFANTVADIRNNLTERISMRGGGQGTVENNLQNIGSELFVDVAGLDFRLVETATDAIDQGVEVDDAGSDFAGEDRPQGGGPDIGAFEFVVQ